MQIVCIERETNFTSQACLCTLLILCSIHLWLLLLTFLRLIIFYWFYCSFSVHIVMNHCLWKTCKRFVWKDAIVNIFEGILACTVLPREGSSTKHLKVFLSPNFFFKFFVFSCNLPSYSISLFKYFKHRCIWQSSHEG